MYYIFGLGNPGAVYQNTRHNVGRMCLKQLAASGQFNEWSRNKGAAALYARGTIADTPVELLLPETYMNKSGQTARYVQSKLGADSALFVVVYDDVDIPFGSIKVSVGGGASGHNGIKSITQALGTPEYIRVRIGIAPTSFWTGAPKRPAGAALPAFVLKPFSRREAKALPEVYARTEEILAAIVTAGASVAMNRYN